MEQQIVSFFRCLLGFMLTFFIFMVSYHSSYSSHLSACASLSTAVTFDLLAHPDGVVAITTAPALNQLDPPGAPAENKHRPLPFISLAALHRVVRPTYAHISVVILNTHLNCTCEKC